MLIGTNTYTAIGLFTTCGLMILGLLATYPAVIASGKGGNFVKWYVFSVLLFPIALIASFTIHAKSQNKA
jgi:hypothetical protein